MHVFERLQLAYIALFAHFSQDRRALAIITATPNLVLHAKTGSAGLGINHHFSIISHESGQKKILVFFVKRPFSFDKVLPEH